MTLNYGKTFSAKFLSNRLQVGEISNSTNFEVTIFIGLHNATAYLPEIKESILKQRNQNFTLLVIDNFSTDDTWNQIKTWSEEFKGRIILVRNNVNIGGTANLYFAMDLIETDWFIQFHQDDIYLENHVEVIVENIRKANDNVVGITTEMGSISESGTRLPTKNRSVWLIAKKSAPEIFIANLFTHSIYWPSSAFRKSIFKSIYVPWHSSAFSDTEIILRMGAMGDFVLVPIQTMFYRENPQSMSHFIEKNESELIAAVGLIRVFSSTEFSKIIKECNQDLLIDFLSKLKEGIRHRIKQENLSFVVYLGAVENANLATDYCSKIVLTELKKCYEEIGAIRTTETLANFISPREGIRLQGLKNQVKELSQRKKPSNIFISVLHFFLPIHIELSIRKFIFKLYLGIKPRHPWNFALKKKKNQD